MSSLLDRLRALFASPEDSASLAAPDGLQLAVAALLVEAARMDDRFDAGERAAIERVLAARFSLPPAETRDLLAAAERASAESNHLFRFTETAVRRFDPEERIRLIEMLWEVALADGHVHPDEDALVRRIAGLVHVEDRDRGAARRRVLERLALTQDK